MLKLPGYQILFKLHESLNSQVYRGIRCQDSLPVVLKVLRNRYPTPEEITRYKLEYDITRHLNLAGVIRAYDFQPYQNTFVMCLEDFGGESLEEILASRAFELSETLDLIRRIATILQQIHTAQVIHKDINLSNIIWNSKTNELKLIDFGISTILSRETPTFVHPELLEGTVASMSPEQTGRMNRVLDYRTDFYSLGVSFYQLLTRHLPFESTDVLELIHSHLAIEPVSPHQRCPEIPKPVSDIVMKLLAKSADDRYQSAFGLCFDIEHCLSQLQTSGHIVEFPLGQHDLSDHFRIPQKLYGREQDIQTLLAAFERVVGQQHPDSHDQPDRPTVQSSVQPSHARVEWVLVSGYAGIGKSVLVQEIYRPITRQRGYFVVGKFDQYQRSIPYVAIAQAFQQLVRQLLTEPETQLNQWRERLLSALGSNAQIMTELIPSLEQIIGPQPEVAVLPPLESQNRFNRVLQKFIQVFAQPEHPLVLFLDDLQWADTASLKLLQLLGTSTERQALLLIGAYRDQEVTATHPLRLMIEEGQRAGVTLNHLALKPLHLRDIQRLVADTLHCDYDRVGPLSQLVQHKTGGNPFFMNEFLKSLYAEGLIWFDAQQAAWQWSLECIQSQSITDNVVDLMASKIQRLSARCQTALQRAACIGNPFHLETLAIACDDSPQAIALALREAMVEGLVVALSNAYKSIELGIDLPEGSLPVTYRFAHDRIQQAAYSLIAVGDRPLVHYRIGTLLRDKPSTTQQGSGVFELVNQLNLGRTLMDSATERADLARLNLTAGERAKAATAYDSAAQYFQIGLDLLTPTTWQTDYTLTLALHNAMVEAAYLIGDFDRVDQLFEVIGDRTTALGDRISAYDAKIQARVAQGQLLSAIQIGLHGLRQLAIELPEQPTPDDFQTALSATAARLANQSIDALLNRPMMIDPSALAAMQLLASMCAAAFLAVPALFPLIVLKMVDLLVEHGTMRLAPFAYGAYGLILCGIVLDIEAGYQFGQLALLLLDRLDAKAIQARTLFPVHNQINVWKTHIRHSLKPLQFCYQVGVEQGDLEFAGYAAMHFCGYSFWVGQSLADLQLQLANYDQAIRQIKHQTGIDFLSICWQTVLNLVYPTAQPDCLTGDVYDETIGLEQLQQTNFHGGLFFLYLNKLFLAYLFHNDEHAVDYATLAEPYVGGMTGAALIAIFRFYDSLARLAVYSTASASAQEDLLKTVAANQALMNLWASHAPMNYLHKWYLVEAERDRVLGETHQAMDAYDRAIALAHEHGYLHEEAIAHERAALFYLAQDKPIIARAYLQEAHYGYQRWGALAKVAVLEAQFPQWLGREARRSSQLTLHPQISSSGKITALDLASVLKASQAIAREMRLDQLLTQLMNILLENAGAQRGYLLLSTGGQLYIEAVGSATANAVEVLQSLPLEHLATDETTSPLPLAVIRYVAHTRESVVLDDAAHVGNFRDDPWITRHQTQSLLCYPLLNQGTLTGLVYLENNLTPGAFTSERLEVLNILSAQAAISIDNARLLAQQAQLNASLRVEIAERQQAEKVRDRLIAILEASTDVTAIMGTQGELLWLNTAAKRLIDLQPGDSLTSVQMACFHPDWAYQVIQTQGLPAAAQDTIWVGETALRRHDSSEFPVSQMIIAHKTATGQVEYFSTIMRDISAIKVAEAEVRQLNAELEQRVLQRTAQLEAANQELESFAYSVSHDLRAPLRAIDGFSRLLQDDYAAKLAPEANRYLAIVRDSAKRMGELIDDLLRLSRLNRKALHHQWVQPNELLQDVLTNLHADIQNRQIEFAIAHLPPCYADPSLLKQVWLNLVANAIKYTQYKPVAQIEIGYENLNGEGVYHIRDNGAGFDMAYADNLFGVFQRLHRDDEFEGMGVGLAIVQRIVHRHGGRIWAEAAVDQGATFFFTVPSGSPL